MLDDAIKLAAAADYVNAGTVEFLVSPEDGNYYFIECNPRIQVEHTVTEQVTGIDLVETQFHIAGGASLASLGLADQAAVGTARGYAIQARVVATGGGTITGYKEPSGPGIRVDGCGYLGYAPPSQFDPLLAKLICTSNSTRTLPSAIARTLAALDEFHIGGLPTNLAQLRAILGKSDIGNGDARTTLMAEHAELSSDNLGQSSGEAVGFLEQQASALIGPGSGQKKSQFESNLPPLEIGDSATGLECPMDGTILEWSVVAGARVNVGETLFVISAMKMEAAVAAPCSGTVTAIQTVRVGDAVIAGQVVAGITPDTGDAERDLAALDINETWTPKSRPCSNWPKPVWRPVPKTPAWSDSVRAAN